MSTDQTRRLLNQIDNELANLEKKLAELTKKEADKTKKIYDLQRSITKNSPTSIVASKLRQIQGYKDEIARAKKDIANINKSIAEKRRRRADTAIKLQREEAADMRKENEAWQELQRRYERRIEDLSAQITKQLFDKESPRHPYKLEGYIEYDVFISHASEDKVEFADALYTELKNRGIKVWYDEISIEWGDSLRAKIDDGLKKSLFGIVILSKHYIRKGWTQYELDGLFQSEMTTGKKILPIWHNITKDEVQAFSPSLAGRKALNTAMFSTDEIADELIKLIQNYRKTATEWEDSSNE